MPYIYRQWYHCGSLALVQEDFRWSLCLPDGKYTRGQADSLEAAKQAIDLEYSRFALDCWSRGRHEAGGLMVCPLPRKGR